MDLSMYLDDFEYVCLVVAWFVVCFTKKSCYIVLYYFTCSIKKYTKYSGRMRVDLSWNTTRITRAMLIILKKVLSISTFERSFANEYFLFSFLSIFRITNWWFPEIRAKIEILKRWLVTSIDLLLSSFDLRRWCWMNYYKLLS